MACGIKTIHFFGFSVTRHGSPTTYVEEIGKLRVDYTITSSALGGVSFELLPYIMPMICKDRPEILVLEVGTSGFSKDCRSSIRDVEKIILEIIGSANQYGIKNLIFMMLPRNDLPKPCIIMEALSRLSKLYDFGILNLQHAYENNWTEYSNDRVHPNKNGVLFIANQFSIFLDEYLNKCHDLVSQNNLTNYKDFLSVIECGDLFNHPLLTKFESSGFNFLFPSLPSGISISTKFNFDIKLEGFLYLMGPDTSSIRIHGNSIDVAMKTFDENCYYYRIGFRSLYAPTTVLKNTEIIIDSLSDRNGISLLRESRFPTVGLRNYPIGFCFTRDLS
jgi:hypothetical protein